LFPSKQPSESSTSSPAKSAKSGKSQKSSKSVKSVKANKSVKADKSAKANKSVKAAKSYRRYFEFKDSKKYLCDDDDDDDDDFLCSDSDMKHKSWYVHPVSMGGNHFFLKNYYTDLYLSVAEDDTVALVDKEYNSWFLEEGDKNGPAEALCYSNSDGKIYVLCADDDDETLILQDFVNFGSLDDECVIASND